MESGPLDRICTACPPRPRTYSSLPVAAWPRPRDGRPPRRTVEIPSCTNRPATIIPRRAGPHDTDIGEVSWWTAPRFSCHDSVPGWRGRQVLARETGGEFSGLLKSPPVTAPGLSGDECVRRLPCHMLWGTIVSSRVCDGRPATTRAPFRVRLRSSPPAAARVRRFQARSSASTVAIARRMTRPWAAARAGATYRGSVRRTRCLGQPPVHRAESHRRDERPGQPEARGPPPDRGPSCPGRQSTRKREAAGANRCLARIRPRAPNETRIPAQLADVPGLHVEDAVHQVVTNVVDPERLAGSRRGCRPSTARFRPRNQGRLGCLSARPAASVPETWTACAALPRGRGRPPRPSACDRPRAPKCPRGRTGRARPATPRARGLPRPAPSPSGRSCRWRNIHRNWISRRPRDRTHRPAPAGTRTPPPAAVVAAQPPQARDGERAKEDVGDPRLEAVRFLDVMPVHPVCVERVRPLGAGS